MNTNQILNDLHSTRRKLLAEAGGTIEGLGAALRKRQQESGRRILKTHQTIRCAEASKSSDSEVDNRSQALGD